MSVIYSERSHVSIDKKKTKQKKTTITQNYDNILLCLFEIIYTQLNYNSIFGKILLIIILLKIYFEKSNC